MATKGVELASAYISLGISVDDVPRQVKKALNGSTRDAQQAGTRLGTTYSNAVGVAAASGMTGHGKTSAGKFSDGFQSEAERKGHRVGTAVGTVIGRGIGTAISLSLTAATAGLAGVVGGIGFTLFKGFERYKSLDATAKRLGNMGKTADQVKSIMADINEVVEGTPIALDAAAGAATKFLSGGVKEGKELKDALTGIADAAGASGTDFAHLADIFQKVSIKGKLMGDDTAQLEENLVPITAWLKELPHLTADGVVTFQEFLEAVQHGAGGAAKTAADTIDGAITQMQTSVARVGANFLSAIFGDPLSTTEGPGGMAEAINKVTTKINDLNTWVGAHQGEIKQFFTDAAETVKTLATQLTNVGTWLVDHKDVIAGIATAFAGWKVAGLLADLGKVGGLLGTGGKGGKGGSGILGQLGLAIGLAGTLDYLTSDRGPNDGPNFTGQATGAASGAFIGGQFGGFPGAVIGGAAGSTIAPITDFLNPPGPAQNGVLPTAPGQHGGQTPTVGGIPIPGLIVPNTPTGGGAASGANSFFGTGASTSRSLPQGYGLPKGSNSGGYGGTGVQFPDWVSQISAAFGIKPSTYPGHQEGSGLNKGIDWSGPVANMQRFAEYLAGLGMMEQVIWNNPNTGQRIGVADGQPVGPGTSQPGYYGNDWGDHANHVHTRQSMPIPLPRFATGGAAYGSGSGTSDSIPAYLSNGEHVLTAQEVAMMGGQAGVYQFRDALHRKTGGSITWMDLIKQGSAGGGGSFKGPGVGDIGERIDSPHKPQNPIWGDWSTGLIPGEMWQPRGPHKDVGTFAPWWMFPGEPSQQRGGVFGMDPRSPDWKRRKNITGFATGGAIDPELLKRFQEGLAAGKPEGGTPPGMPPEMLQTAMGGGNAAAAMQQPAPFSSDVMDAGRTEGFVPAAAGFTGKTGGGLAGSLLGMGAEAINGLIDAAASAASMGASIAGGGPGAAMGIQMGAAIAKRGVEYAAEMGGIGIGAFTEIMMPFGAPRWLSDVDATAFMPSPGIQPAAVTSGEQAQQEAMAQQHGQTAGQPPGPGAAAAAIQQVSPVTPAAMAPKPMDTFAMSGAKQSAQSGFAAAKPGGQNPLDLLKGFFPFDDGGWLKPGMAGINMSNRPEPVFNAQQWKTMEATAAAQPAISGRGTKTENHFHVADIDEAMRKAGQRDRLAMMRYAGRP